MWEVPPQNVPRTTFTSKLFSSKYYPPRTVFSSEYGRYWYTGMARVPHMRNTNMHRNITTFQESILARNYSVGPGLHAFAIDSS